MEKPNPCFTVTRKGDQFIYQHIMDKEPTTRTLDDIMDTAGSLAERNYKAVCALSFIARALTAIANAPADLDEYGIKGVSALCEMVSEATLEDLDNEHYHADLNIIKQMAKNGCEGVN